MTAGLTLWMKASAAAPAAGGTLTSWPVSGGVAQTFTQSGTQSVLTQAINFNPAVRFNTSGKLVGSASIGMSEFAAVVAWTGAPNTPRGAVVGPTTSNSTGASRYAFQSFSSGTAAVFAGIFDVSAAFGYMSASPAPPSGEFHLWVASGTGNVLRRDGVQVGSGAYGSAAMSGIPQIGDRSTNDGKLNGDLAEVIVYNASKAADRSRIESYLALKYGITLADVTASSFSSTGLELWSADAAYSHDRFGIGRDDGFGLVHLRSNSLNTGSGDGTGQPGKGNIVLSDPSTLDDQDFLMLGSDGADLSAVLTNLPSFIALSARVNRQWKVQRAGDVGTVTLRFDMAGLAMRDRCAAGCVMLVDHDGDGNFLTGQVTVIRPAVRVCDRVVFKSVYLPHGAVLTFAAER